MAPQAKSTEPVEPDSTERPRAIVESFGVPYLTPFAVSAGKEAREHVFLRRPLPLVKDRPPALHPLNRRKQR